MSKARSSAIPALFLAAPLLATLGGCTALETAPKPAPVSEPVAERLDRLYRTDRAVWRDAMRAALLADESDLPERHLALAIEAFNDQQDRTLVLESAWRYLDTRKGPGPQLESGTDRQLLAFLAEDALRSADGKQREQLERLCLTLEREPVCRR